ncbi:MAG: hypothetical protein AB8B71_14190 [Paracoccaceae bacterium]
MADTTARPRAVAYHAIAQVEIESYDLRKDTGDIGPRKVDFGSIATCVVTAEVS